jgi:molybdopterin synthase catalytic subunit
VDFQISSKPLTPEIYKATLQNPACGGYVCFEGWVRDFNENKHVTHLEYEAYPALAAREAQKIFAEAQQKFGIKDAKCVHRVGDLQIGEIAVWVGVIGVHRGEAFKACEYIIDELKVRVPIWKKEHYQSGDSGWVECHECKKHAHDHKHTH